MAYKLYHIAGFVVHPDAPVINGHKGREMIRVEHEGYNEKQIKKLLIALRNADRFYQDEARIFPVLMAATEFSSDLNALNNDNLLALMNVDRRFRAYSLEFDVFLDYWAKHIAHYKPFGGQEDKTVIQEYKALYQTLTRKAYSDHLEYRLIDLLRNHTMHVSSPIGRFHVGVKGNEVFADRDYLLENFGNGESKRKILAEQPKELNLGAIVEATYQCVCEIQEGLMGFQINEELYRSCQNIGEFITAVEKDHLDEKLWLIIDETDDIGRFTNVDCQTIHIEKYKSICEKVINRFER